MGEFYLSFGHFYIHVVYFSLVKQITDTQVSTTNVFLSWDTSDYSRWSRKALSINDEVFGKYKQLN